MHTVVKTMINFTCTTEVKKEEEEKGRRGERREEEGRRRALRVHKMCQRSDIPK